MQKINVFLWALIARFLSNELITKLLVKIAMKNPYEHLGGYMLRYWLISPALKLPFTVRLHYINRPDKDNVLHNHPFNWRSIILSGWYIEELADGSKVARFSGTSRAANANELHRIDCISAGGVWSLFIMGRKYQEWGFMVNNEKLNAPRLVHHNKFNSINGRVE